MAEFVRVADKETGHHVSIPKPRYDANPDLWRKVNSPAIYADGTPRPTKYHRQLEPANSFAGMTVAQLGEEIERRNADRDPESDDFIRVDAPGNKPELLAALTADNAPASADSDAAGAADSGSDD